MRLQQRMANRLMTTTGVALALVLLFAVNILANRTLGSVRLDLTENRLFTLSQGTRNILQGLEEPVILRFYLSQSELGKAPGLAGYAARVRALLNEYERLSDGKVALHVIDPEPFSEEEDRAVAYGLRGAPLGADKGVFYFGLAGSNSIDNDDVIPFFAAERQEYLEYDVTKLIHNLTRPEQKIVGLLSSLPIEGVQGQAGQPSPNAPPWTILQQIRQLFEVRSLHPQTLEEIPADIDVLMLVHPQGLSNKAIYAIDQYVLRGGRVAAFVDPYAEEQQPGAGGFTRPGAPRRSELGELLLAWGVKLGDEVVGDLNLSMKVRMEQQGRSPVTFDYPVWMNVTPQTFNQEDIITGNLGNLGFGTPGYFEPVEDAATVFTALVTTTPGAARFTTAQVTAVTTDPRVLLDGYTRSDRAYAMVARVSGKARTTFPEGPPLPEDGDEIKAPSAPHVSASTDDIQIILFADTDMLADRFWVVVREILGTRLAVPGAANNTLVINAIENLTGSSDLISVRNRGAFTRPFTRVVTLRQEAERAYRKKEQGLRAQLKETERRLAELEKNNQGNDTVILTDAQRNEIVGFRQEKVRVRKELREVRRQLRTDIEALESTLKFANIGLVPILIGLGGLVSGLAQLQRRRRMIASTGAAA